QIEKQKWFARSVSGSELVRLSAVCPLVSGKVPKPFPFNREQYADSRPRLSVIRGSSSGEIRRQEASQAARNGARTSGSPDQMGDGGQCYLSSPQAPVRRAEWRRS